MTPDIFAKIVRFMDIVTERFERNIMPTENDRVWFERNKRTNINGWLRLYRVRESIATDHFVFQVLGASPKGSITIISRSPPTIAVLKAKEDVFGPVVNSDQYATMRLQHLAKEIDEFNAESAVP